MTIKQKVFREICLKFYFYPSNVNLNTSLILLRAGPKPIDAVNQGNFVQIFPREAPTAGTAAGISLDP